MFFGWSAVGLRRCHGLKLNENRVLEYNRPLLGLRGEIERFQMKHCIHVTSQCCNWPFVSFDLKRSRFFMFVVSRCYAR